MTGRHRTSQAYFQDYRKVFIIFFGLLSTYSQSKCNLLHNTRSSLSPLSHPSPPLSSGAVAFEVFLVHRALLLLLSILHLSAVSLVVLLVHGVGYEFTLLLLLLLLLLLYAGVTRSRSDSSSVLRTRAHHKLRPRRSHWSVGRGAVEVGERQGCQANARRLRSSRSWNVICWVRGGRSSSTALG